MELGHGHPVVTTILLTTSKSTSNMSSSSAQLQLKENQLKITGQLSTSYIYHLTMLIGLPTKKTALIRLVGLDTETLKLLGSAVVLSFLWPLL